MLKPRKLQPGDTVATVSLSWGGPGTFPHRYEAGKHQLEAEFGVRVIEMPHTLKDPAWVAANPRARADDLMQAFADPAIKAVISTIGGEDSIRLLPYLDLNLLRDNPKIFMGYSDTTVTHFALFKAGVTSFYGPSIMAGFAENGGLHAYTAAAVRQILFEEKVPGLIAPNTSGWTVEMMNWADPLNQTHKRTLTPNTGWKYLQGTGRHRGPLIGGCLEVLDWLRGTSVWPELDRWQNAILFLETSEEAPTPLQVVRMLRPLAAMGILHKLSGILYGRPGGPISPERFAEFDQAILQVVATEQGLTDLPIITGMDFGHTDPMCVLPYGVLAEIDCHAHTVSILESAVTA